VTAKPLCIELLKKVTHKRAGCWLNSKLTWMRQSGSHLCLKFVADFVLCCVFEIRFWFFVLVTAKPLCILLHVMVAHMRTSCWLKPKLTLMRETCADLCLKFVADFVLNYLMLPTRPPSAVPATPPF
jgi:hypothetical protein